MRATQQGKDHQNAMPDSYPRVELSDNSALYYYVRKYKGRLGIYINTPAVLTNPDRFIRLETGKWSNRT